MFKITTLSGEGKCGKTKVLDGDIYTLLCHVCEEPKERLFFCFIIIASQEIEVALN